MTISQQPDPDIKASLRASRIFCGAMIGGVTLFALIAIGLDATGGMGGPSMEDKNGIVRAIVATIVGGCLSVARLGYRKGKEKTKNLTGSLNDKLNNHRSLLVRYMAACEVAALSSVIGFFLTGDYLLLTATGLALLAMLYVMPTKNKIVNDLELDWNEQSQL